MGDKTKNEDPMLMTAEQPRRTGARDALVIAALAAALAIATLAAISVQAHSEGTLPGSTTAIVNDGLPGKGLPPSPGPTNPDGAE
jgi:hypothetical protein